MTSPDQRHRVQFSKFVQESARPGYKKLVGGLNRCWNRWNKKFFDGKMVVPYILLAQPTHPSAIGTYCPVTSFGKAAEIQIRPTVAWGGHPLVKSGGDFAAGRFRYVADILLHEMIHQWQHEVVKNLEETQAGHGRIFRDKCNEIGKCLRLEPVRTAKARGKDRDRPSCSQWPHNVRPPGYYRGSLVMRCGLTPIGGLCRAARELGKSPNDPSLLLELVESAIAYAKSLTRH